MSLEKLSRIAGIVGVVLSILTIAFGDNLAIRLLAIDASAAGTVVKAIGVFFFVVGVFATALYLMVRKSPTDSEAWGIAKSFYICCVMVTLAGGTLWDACTTLLGIQKIFQSAAPQASQVQVLIPTVIATGIIFLCILIPSSHVFSGSFHITAKMGFALLFFPTTLFDVCTSIVGNAHFLLGMEDTSLLMAGSFYISRPDTSVTLIAVTVFSSASPIMLSIMFNRLLTLPFGSLPSRR
jgi:hypothetical protein